MCSRLIHAGVKHEAVFVCSLQQQKLQERLHLRGASLHQPSSETMLWIHSGRNRRQIGCKILPGLSLGVVLVGWGPGQSGK